MSAQQLELPLVTRSFSEPRLAGSYRDRLEQLLSGDLDFHGESSAYASHDFHAFPAKFPPQLPRAFIEGLTEPGDVVLDPMAGSGTTAVEAFLLGRWGVAADIDPLALRLCRAKVTPLASQEVAEAGYSVLRGAQESLTKEEEKLSRELEERFGEQDSRFINYWFTFSTQLELIALIREIERIRDNAIREFLELTFSAIIITKSGGVSLARDLAHTRPHRITDKKPRSALEEYRKRLKKNLVSLAALTRGEGIVQVVRCDARRIALADNMVDLIVTSPPYASNAIDYMRAHKFSLIWLRHSLASLSELREEYIGHDAVSGIQPVPLPSPVSWIVDELAKVDFRKAKVLHRYYSEITQSLAEMLRVLRPGKAAVAVVGSSTMRGMDTRTGYCLAEIGQALGFDLVGIAVRKLDRDRRMMPARRKSSPSSSQIEERMHEEYVIGLVKPVSE